MNIIQIGANSGNDHVFNFVSQNKDSINKLILVEPMSVLENSLKECYKDFPQTIIENVAIVPNKTTEKMVFYHANSGNYEVSTFNPTHLLGHGLPEKDLTSSLVSVMTFSELMEKHNLTELDNLFIDTEGMDCNIIRSIDLKRFKIKKIQFESAHSDGINLRGSNFESAVEYLQNHNYEISGHGGFDHLAVLRN